ncbi:hypothetical protein D3C81_1221660 [compost metagenome]
MLRLAMSTMLRVPSSRLLTKAKRLSLLKAISWCPAPVARCLIGLRLAVSITVTPDCPSCAPLLPTHSRRSSGCRATRTGLLPAATESISLNCSLSITATSPAVGIETNTRLLSLGVTQSIGGCFSSIRARVLVMPPTDTDGSTTETLASRFITSRK